MGVCDTCITCAFRVCRLVPILRHEKHAFTRVSPQRFRTCSSPGFGPIEFSVAMDQNFETVEAMQVDVVPLFFAEHGGVARLGGCDWRCDILSAVPEGSPASIRGQNAVRSTVIG